MDEQVRKELWKRIAGVPATVFTVKDNPWEQEPHVQYKPEQLINYLMTKHLHTCMYDNRKVCYDKTVSHVIIETILRESFKHKEWIQSMLTLRPRELPEKMEIPEEINDSADFPMNLFDTAELCIGFMPDGSMNCIVYFYTGKSEGWNFIRVKHVVDLMIPKGEELWENLFKFNVAPYAYGKIADELVAIVEQKELEREVSRKLEDAEIEAVRIGLANEED